MFRLNNLAEYQALGWTVKELNRLIPSGTIIIHGDSKLVIEQMNGNWQMKSGAYMETAIRAREVLNELKKKCTVTLKWIPRGENSRADELSTAPMIKAGVKFKIQPQ